MDKWRYILTLALRSKRNEGKHVAFMVLNGKVIAKGVQGERTYDQPIVNILHNHKRFADAVICSTGVPTDMCLGLAWQNGVQYIVYLDGLTPRIITIKKDTIHPAAGLAVGDPFTVAKRVDGHGWHARKERLSTFPDTEQALTNWIAAFNQDVTLANDAYTLYDSQENCPNVYRKRVSEDTEKTMLARLASSIPIQAGSCLTTQENKDRLWMKIAYALAGAALPDKRDTGESPLPHGHNVAAIMVDSTDTIIGWGVNINDLNKNRCYHAETAMLLAYLLSSDSDRLPAAIRIYSTLAPCHMCAGLITSLGNNVPVVVGHMDPRITNSTLDQGKNGSIQRMTTMMPITRAAQTVFDPNKGLQQSDHGVWMANFQNTHKRMPTAADWLTAQHKGDRANKAVTKFLNTNPAPSQLFSYNLDSLQKLLDDQVGDPGEDAILTRGIDLIKKIRSNGLIS